MKQLYKFKRAYESQKIASILREYNIPEHNIDKIMDRIDYKLYFYDEGITHTELSALERLSIIPLCLVLIIMFFIVMPIKWICTGKFRFEADKPKWLWEWVSKFD